jgi:hypothetical protein
MPPVRTWLGGCLPLLADGQELLSCFWVFKGVLISPKLVISPVWV